MLYFKCPTKALACAMYMRYGSTVDHQVFSSGIIDKHQINHNS